MDKGRQGAGEPVEVAGGGGGGGGCRGTHEGGPEVAGCHTVFHTQWACDGLAAGSRWTRSTIHEPVTLVVTVTTLDGGRREMHDVVPSVALRTPRSFRRMNM